MRPCADTARFGTVRIKLHHLMPTPDANKRDVRVRATRADAAARSSEQDAAPHDWAGKQRSISENGPRRPEVGGRKKPQAFARCGSTGDLKIDWL
jgi:hypothetical protein